MSQIQKTIILFIPLIFIVFFFFFVRVIQYKPLHPSQESIDAYNKKLTSFTIPILPEDPITGNKKAEKTIVIFSDYACGPCASVQNTLSSVFEKHPKAFKVIWKGLSNNVKPLPNNDAHRVAYCANQQNKFTAFTKTAYALRGAFSANTLATLPDEINLRKKRFTTCLDSELPDNYIDQNSAIAQLLQIQQLPAIFYNDKQIQQPQTVEEWEIVLGLN